MLRHPEYTRERLAAMATRLATRIHPEVRALDRLAVSGPCERIAEEAARALAYRDAHLGEAFGPLWATYWFQAEATVPREWAGAPVDLLWVSRSEATLWIDGRSIQGLNTGSEGERPDARLRDRATGGETLRFAIEMACNGKFGDVERPYRSVQPFVLDRCEIARFDPDAWVLWLDFSVLQELEAHLARHISDPAWQGRLLAELNRFCNEEDPAILAALLQERNPSFAHELSAIGHAHMDTAWLWPIAETYRKCVRTFSSQTCYMDRYPAFRFACSQAQQYAWIRDRNPDLYERIRERARRGQWIPVGGTWVEPDCNLPSGESLVRQFLHGQRFFEREFGARCREFWQPDVFGYNGQLPQIMRGAGIDRFLTQKLSWNRFNQPPHHTFTWQGIDGSEVLAHFPPADTYNADASVALMRENVGNFKDHDRSRESLMLFGWGDGGGGPTPRMIETIARVSDLQGLPRTQIRTSDEFFDRLERDCVDRPTIVGELYFELHRGTYTTQARTKRGNRLCEGLLHDVELVAAIAARAGRAPYPRAELQAIWERVLTNQFHDILPGSSIALVYEDTEREHSADAVALAELLDRSLAALGTGDRTAPVNTAPFARVGTVDGPAGSPVWVDCPPAGVGAIVPAADAVTVQELADGAIVLENATLRATLTAGGALRSLVHRSTGREALRGAANVLELYDDTPVEWDAWDVDPFHLETRRECAPATSARRGHVCDLRAEIVFERAVGEASTLVQTVRLDAGADRLEFHTVVDWRERKRLLKVAFELAVRAPNATYEMQFGVVERPTHFSTSHDLARYEVPGHRFADLSEHGFGVAVLTDCKYGYSCHGDTLRISLLRAPSEPDPDADQGQHAFAYAVMPHAGGFAEGGVVAAGLAFNRPLRWAPHGAAPGAWAAVDGDGLVLDTIKLAEDGDDLILRLYEAHGGRGTALLSLGSAFGSARLANLLEDPGEPLAVDPAGRIVVPYLPFAIVTVRVAR